jgi:hypothetical protein
MGGHNNVSSGGRSIRGCMTRIGDVRDVFNKL